MEFNIDKVAFKIFGISVMWYGIIIGIGIFSGIYFALKLAKKKNITEDSIMEMLIYAIPISLIGARLYYVIFEWRYYVANPSKILAFREGGMAIHGGIIFASITAYIYCKKNNIKFSDMADISAPGLALGQAIGRWGNFINQEAYGRETTLPWALLIDGKLVHLSLIHI